MTHSGQCSLHISTVSFKSNDVHLFYPEEKYFRIYFCIHLSLYMDLMDYTVECYIRMMESHCSIKIPAISWPGSVMFQEESPYN